MGFRDETEAMRARIDVLERERDDALQEIGRLQVDHRQAADSAEQSAKRVAELEGQLGGRLPRSAWVRIGSLAAVGAVLVMGALLYARAAERERAAADAAREQTEKSLRQTTAELDGARRQITRAEAESAEAIARAERVEAERAREQSGASISVQVGSERLAQDLMEALTQSAGEPSTPTQTLQVWQSRVRRVQGAAPVARGKPCAVVARLWRDGTDVRDVTVDIQCGQAHLYDWDEALGSGMEMRGCRTHVPEGTGAGIVDLECSDQGARTGRPQLALDTAHRTVSVWKDGVPTFRVELQLVGRGVVQAP